MSSSVHPPDSTCLATGTILDDRYEVRGFLGRGAMATVYEVRHVGLHSHHALKILDAELAADEGVRERFVAEGRIQARLRHPNIVAVTEIVTRPVAGLVLDLVRGPDLASHLRSLGKPLDPRSALAILRPVVDAVATAHRAGIVHRDLKPENILLDRGPHGELVPRVTDFGIAHIAEGSEVAGRKRQTRAGARLGTLLYMSPEQVRGLPVDGRTDVFALGAILYELLAGRPAFEGETEFDTMRAIAEGGYPPLAALVPDVPPMLLSVVDRALAIEPGDRFADPASLGVALELLAHQRGGSRQGDAGPAASAPTRAAPPAPPRAAAARPSARTVLDVEACAPDAPARAPAPAPFGPPVLAAVLSLAFVFVGQLYNRDWIKGLLGVAVLAALVLSGRLSPSEVLISTTLLRLVLAADAALTARSRHAPRAV